ncbi:MAG: ATP-dependent zinc metalloprotease FtsH [Planctomycetota bacterium]|jgi:cell division protease FtsH
MEPSSSEPHNDSSERPRPPRPSRPPEGEPPRPFFAGPVFIIGILLMVFLWWAVQETMNQKETVKYSFFLNQLEADNVESIKATGDSIEGKWRKIPADPDQPDREFGDTFKTTIPIWGRDDDEFRRALRKHDVGQYAEAPEIGFGTQILIYVGLSAVFIFLMLNLLRRNADPMGSGFLGAFSRSPAKRFQASEQRTSFKDVAAMEQAKSELMEVVEFLKNPAKFQKLGAQIPKGVLLLGPPGTGKTLLARATAGEAGVPFYSINGSEFIQMFVGVGASRVRDLFQNAKDHAPCIIFIDEIDAVGRHRGAGLGGGHDEREQTLNQILSEMDGFEQQESVIVLAATNRPDVLDPALLRPGRFDRHVTIDRPTKEGRVAILKVHTRKVPLGDDVHLEDVAGASTGFSGAELKNLVNEAALLAVRADRRFVTMDDFEAARDRVLMGPKREEILNIKEKRMTAYHEAGHALLGWFQPEVDEVHKVTIIPRGRALGVTQFQPDEERFHVGESRLHAQLAMMLAGRAAEKLVFDQYSAGAESDLKQATRMARNMVAHWGMSEKVGPVAFRHGEEHPFLGKEIHEHREFSEETAHLIDTEVSRILRDAQRHATEVLEEHRDDLDRMSDELLQKETLHHDDLIALLGEPVTLADEDDEGRETLPEKSDA